MTAYLTAARLGCSPTGGDFQHSGLIWEGWLAGSPFASEAPLDINILAKDFVENQRSILDIHQVMADWLTGFPIRNPWPHVNLKTTALRSDDLSIELHYSPELTRKFAKRPSEVVIAARFTYRDLNVSTDRVTIFDTANRFLGEYGATDINFTERKGDAATVFELGILARQNQT